MTEKHRRLFRDHSIKSFDTKGAKDLCFFPYSLFQHNFALSTCPQVGNTSYNTLALQALTSFYFCALILVFRHSQHTRNITLAAWSLEKSRNSNIYFSHIDKITHALR